MTVGDIENALPRNAKILIVDHQLRRIYKGPIRLFYPEFAGLSRDRHIEKMVFSTTWFLWPFFKREWLISLEDEG